MALLTKSELFEKIRLTSGYEYESNIRNFAARELLAERKTADLIPRIYDIFLSHASEDAIYIKALRDELVTAGFSVYVDWIEDPQLDRSAVSKKTAAWLRERMKNCKCLLYATSDAARKSVWMPWELGYMDSHTKSRVAIVPIVDYGQQGAEFKGREYLGLYPYLDKTGASFWIHQSFGTMHLTKQDITPILTHVQGPAEIPERPGCSQFHGRGGPRLFRIPALA